MRLFSIVTLGVVALFAPFSLPAQTSPSAPTPSARMANPEALLPIIKKGGTIILMRHERTEVPAGDDDYSKPVSDCTAQRNLSVAGYAGAFETGKVFAALGVPVGQVLSSPMCRTMDTARIAFGKATAEAKLMHHLPTPDRTMEIAGADLKTLIATLNPTTDNVILVSHIINIERALGITLSEGEMVVLVRNADAVPRIVGRAMPADFAPYARAALRPKK